MEKLPIIKVDKIMLSPLMLADVPNIIEYASDKLIADTTQNMPHPYAEEDAIFWINLAHQGLKDSTQYIFAVRRLEDESFVGGIGLSVNTRFNRAEMGYWIGVPFWNKGYATAAVGAILKFGFEEAGIHRIYAQHLVENPASGKVMMKNGMTYEGEFRDHTKKEGIYKSVKQYGLTQSDSPISVK